MSCLEERDLRALPDLRSIEVQDESVELRLLARRAILHLAGALPPGDDRRSTVRTPPLDDLDPFKRILAIRARAVRAKPDDLEKLEQRVESEQDPTVRSELALALGVSGGKTRIPVLERLLEDAHPEVRRSALEGMELMRDPAAYPYFVRYARDVDNDLRACSLRALAKLGRVNVLRLCQAMCKSPTEWMAYSGVHVLAELKDSEYLPLFDELRSHPSSEVRDKARDGVEQLLSVVQEEARALLARVCPEEGKNLPNRDEAPSRSVSLPDPDSLGLADPDPLVRQKYVALVEDRNDADLVPTLVAQIPVETDVRVLSTLVAVVGRMGDKNAVEAIVPLLDSPNDRVRANSVEAVALLAAPEDRRRMLRCLNDPNHRVRTNAILALWGQNFPGVRDALLQLATAREKKCRLAAIYAIGELGEPASGILPGLLADPDPEVAQRAQDCQRKIGLAETPEEFGPVKAVAPESSSSSESHPSDLASLRSFMQEKKEAFDQALRDLAEAYMDRVGKELVAPPEICPLIAVVTQYRLKVKHNKPETRAALNQRLEALGRGLHRGKVWTEGLGQEILARIDVLDAELLSRSGKLATLEKQRTRTRFFYVALSALAVCAVLGAHLAGLF